MRNAKQQFSLVLFSFAMVAAFALSGCGGGGGGSAGMDTGMMPGTGGGETGMTPGTDPGTGGGQTPTEPPTEPPTDPPTPMPYVVDGLVANPSTSFIAESAADTVESVLAQGEMLSPLTVGIERNPSTGPDRGVTASKDGMTYLKSISSDGAGGYHANYVIGGQETPVHLTTADVYQNRAFDYRKQLDDGSSYWLWAYSSFFNSLFTYFDGSGWLYFPASSDTELNRRGVTIYGARTAPENLPAMGSAIYEGRMRGDIWNADDPSFNSSRRRLRSFLTLKANFDDGEISGWIHRFQLISSRADGENSQNLARGNLISISGGEIDDGRFTADWTGSDSNMDPDLNYSVGGFSGKMLGEFFGPAAEEVGGVVNGSRAATATTPEQHLFGMFGAIGRPLRDVRDSTETFEPDLSSSLEQGFSGADIGFRTPDQGEAYVKSIAYDGAGGASVTYVIDGVETVINFSAGDVHRNVNNLNKIVGDKDYTLWRYGFVANDLNYAEVTGWARDINDPAGVAIKRYRGVNVHGIATENMPNTGSATYEGNVYADAWAENDPDGSSRTRLLGNLTLEANFGNSGVTGQIDGFRIRNPGVSNYVDMASGNSIGISNGAIAGNGFTADWTGMDTNANSAYGDSVRGFSGTMSGGFYGPAAEEVAGELSGSRAATGQIMLGVFGGKQMP